MPMRPVSLAHLTVLDADPVGLIEAGKAAGFSAVGLRVVAPLASDAIIPVVGDAALQRRIKRSLADTGMRILDIEAVWLKPDTDVEALRPALELGAELGAKFVLTVGFDATHARLIENFGAFCALANDCGLRTMLEFIPYASISDLGGARSAAGGAASQRRTAGRCAAPQPFRRPSARHRRVRPPPVFVCPSLRCPSDDPCSGCAADRGAQPQALSRRRTALARCVPGCLSGGHAHRRRGSQRRHSRLAVSRSARALRARRPSIC